nr:MAG TPA: hypothetical protein [Caudoviricetes sp.]
MSDFLGRIGSNPKTPAQPSLSQRTAYARYNRRST